MQKVCNEVGDLAAAVFECFPFGGDVFPEGGAGAVRACFVVANDWPPAAAIMPRRA